MAYTSTMSKICGQLNITNKGKSVWIFGYSIAPMRKLIPTIRNCRHTNSRSICVRILCDMIVIIHLNSTMKQTIHICPNGIVIHFKICCE